MGWHKKIEAESVKHRRANCQSETLLHSLASGVVLLSDNPLHVAVD